jgi:endonuclease/exonuclease/phosphatase (EEP) superfamily protein YafD
MRLVVAWLLVALCGAWVVVRLLGLERGYPLVPLVSFTPFVAAAAVLVVVVAAVLRQRAAALAATVLAVILVGIVAPRALGGPSPPEGPAGPSLRVLSANMHFGTGSPEELVALVRRVRPDVLSVQELSPPLARELEAAGLGELLPEQILQADAGAGIGLYSRLPLSAAATPPGTRQNPLILAGVAVEGAPPVEVAAVHPPPPTEPEIAAWRGDLRALPPATPDGRIRVLAGDFNATLDHAELRRLLDTGYEDAAAEVGAGLKGTWSRKRRFMPPVAIDHVLTDARCGVRSFSTHTITGTDHRAVLAELLLPRG